MKKQRINWQKLWQEFLFSEFVSVRQFLVSKGLLDEDKPLPGGYAKKTKWWSEEKAKFWQEKLAWLRPSISTLQKLHNNLEKAIDTWADMLGYYSDKQKEKIQKWQKAIYIDELIKFWKMLEKYHWITIWTENDKTEIKQEVEISLNEEDKKLLNKILKL